VFSRKCITTFVANVDSKKCNTKIVRFMPLDRWFTESQESIDLMSLWCQSEVTHPCVHFISVQQNLVPYADSFKTLLMSLHLQRKQLFRCEFCLRASHVRNELHYITLHYITLHVLYRALNILQYMYQLHCYLKLHLPLLSALWLMITVYFHLCESFLTSVICGVGC
jgi:hypothetical protein